MPYGDACGPKALERGAAEVVWTDQPFQFSYSVKMEISKLDWPSRIDHYVNISEEKADWVSLAFTFFVVILFTTAVALVIMSALNKDSEVLDALRRTYR